MSNISDNSEHKQDRIKQLKLIKKLTNDNRINSSADMAVNGIWVIKMSNYMYRSAEFRHWETPNRTKWAIASNR